MEELLDENSELIAYLFDSLDKIEESANKDARDFRRLLNGESYLTDDELSKVLKLSRRTLQEYRTEGKIPYYQVGGKILYKESDIRGMLDSGYRKPYRNI